jgi:hypothetical protein
MPDPLKPRQQLGRLHVKSLSDTHQPVEPRRLHPRLENRSVSGQAAAPAER